MAAEDRASARRLELDAELRDEATALDLFQVLRRLETAHPTGPRLGRAFRPSDEPLRLSQVPELAFPPGNIAEYQPGTDGALPRLRTRGIGLLGPNGPLPLHLTEYAFERERHALDPTFSRFLDLFNHRFLLLFYRIWAEARPAVQRDRPAQDRFASYVAALVGLGSPALRDRSGLPDLAVLHHAGRFAAHVRNADGLAALVTNQFGIPARIESFVGTWIDIPPEVRWRLGRGPQSERLGLTTTIGASVWSVQSKFRLVLGPLDEAQFKGLLPGGGTLARLKALVRAYVGPTLSWDLKLMLDAGIERPMQLGHSRMGWTTWLGRRTGGSGERHDVIVDPDAGDRGGAPT
jgi:type VI secretion system protein ImpH